MEPIFYIPVVVNVSLNLPSYNSKLIPGPCSPLSTMNWSLVKMSYFHALAFIFLQACRPWGCLGFPKLWQIS